MPRHLLIRADANTQIGTGHVMRCLALAQAWQDRGGTVSLAARDLPEALATRLRSEHVEIIQFPALAETEDADRLVSASREADAECVVVDGYSFGIVHQKALRDAGLRQLFIDDYGHAKEYVADFVLNQNLTAEESLYKNRAQNTALLLGTGHALLRREFRKLRGRKRDFAEAATKIMLTMGGADPDNVTLVTLQALDELQTNLSVRVVLGAGYSHRTALERFRPQWLLKLEVLTAADMPQMMQWADLALTATGTTCLELMYMGLPFVGVAISDNQRPIASQLKKLKLADTFDCFEPDLGSLLRDSLARLLGSRSERILLGTRGQELVDGEGAVRVAELLSAPVLTLDSATEADCQSVWNWANDPDTRSASFESENIPWEEHVRWYQSKLHDEHARLWICRGEHDAPLGLVRIAIEGSEAVFSIVVNPIQRGKGYGTSMIEAACRKLFCETGIVRIHAYIKPVNTSSVRVFERAGFTRTTSTTVKGQPSLHYLRERS